MHMELDTIWVIWVLDDEDPQKSNVPLVLSQVSPKAAGTKVVGLTRTMMVGLVLMGYGAACGRERGFREGL